MYNQMLTVMDEMLQEVFNDLVAPEDLNNEPWFTSIDYQYKWENVIHYLNLSGLQKANEYQEDVNNNSELSYFVQEYNQMLNGASAGFNHNTCN